MATTNWQNLPSTNTPLNATNLNNDNTEINKRVLKTGDTMSGDLTIDRGNNNTSCFIGSASYKKQNEVRTKNDTIDVGMGVDTGGTYRIWDYTHSKEVVRVSTAGVNSFNGNSNTATSANITRTNDTTNGDKLQIGTGTSVNITNSKHSANSDKLGTSTLGNANKPIYLNSGTATVCNEYVPKSGGTFTGNVKINDGGLDVDRPSSGTEEGFTYLNIGNDVASGTTGNSTARVQLYGNAGKRVRLYCVSGMTANRDVYFPNTAGQITVTSGSSRRIKENIKDMTEEEAKKILDVNVVDFDYKEDFGGEKGCHGVIAEDLNEIIPYAVTINDNYDENKEPDYETNTPPMVNYEKLIPHLIKIVQMQEKRIEELENK